MSYQPNPISDNSVIGQYIQVELNKISDSFRNIEVESVSFKVWNVLPDKPRAGQVYYADGTNWNPGSGEGLYLYLSTGAWSKL